MATTYAIEPIKVAIAMNINQRKKLSFFLKKDSQH